MIEETPRHAGHLDTTRELRTAALAWASRNAARRVQYPVHAVELTRFEQARLTAATGTVERTRYHRADLGNTMLTTAVGTWG